jgi:hypothetical protein
MQTFDVTPHFVDTRHILWIHVWVAGWETPYFQRDERCAQGFQRDSQASDIAPHFVDTRAGCDWETPYPQVYSESLPIGAARQTK